MSKYEERWARTEAFRHDRFGMFIHWGLYAIPARGEWVRSLEKISVEDYEQFFEEFDPYKYDPKAWARLAREAGMKYAVMTTKHHDGFCLFDSAYTDYKATNTKAGRDLIREYVEAFRAEGLKIGFYYSLLDWHHPDYPHYGDRQHPMRDNPAYKNDGRNFDNYLTYMHNQVRELLTNYGKIDIMWFDFSYQDEYNDMRGETWRATDLVNMVRELQPGIILDNRLGGDGAEQTSGDDEPVYAGDFKSPEQTVPAEGLLDDMGRDVAWEACMTLNDHWGYCSADKNYKSAKTVIRMLTECVSKGGNLLLNVGPNAKGEIPRESVEILRQVGRWMDDNGESIYGCGKADVPKPEWGRYTKKGDTYYAHVYDTSTSVLRFDVGREVEKVRLVSDASELVKMRPWNAEHNKKGLVHDVFVDLQNVTLPDEIDTVIKLKVK